VTLVGAGLTLRMSSVLPGWCVAVRQSLRARDCSACQQGSAHRMHSCAPNPVLLNDELCHHTGEVHREWELKLRVLSADPTYQCMLIHTP
jgi:hypothetical protein